MTCGKCLRLLAVRTLKDVYERLLPKREREAVRVEMQGYPKTLEAYLGRIYQITPDDGVLYEAAVEVCESLARHRRTMHFPVRDCRVCRNDAIATALARTMQRPCQRGSLTMASSHHADSGEARRLQDADSIQ
jgi:hypothetical protein